ncbi:MAG: TaqI-like C-terminal specificity domain-containing protein [Deltaproteobacteria bacterium]|nr:TaqI-like C-terminal specificity domain-containing protein [Deltaproteobacteria bacterium]
MANRESLQKALNANYDLTFFRQHVLEPVFGSSLTIYSAPKAELVNPSEAKTITNIKQYGEVRLSDYRQLYLYEVALAENVIVERNKVSIGAVIKRLIAGNNAVLVNFYYPHQAGKSWRLSFIAKDQVIDDGEIRKTETHPKRYTYVLGPKESCRTAADRFAKLSLGTDFTADKLKEAFSVEKLSEKFFEDYKYIHYSGLIQYITGERIVRKDKKDIFERVQDPSPLFKAVFLKGKGEDDAKKDVRDFVKKLLGRIVFLSFVQKKGWLGASDERWKDGDANFLQSLFEASGEGSDFYHNWLRKLFYDSLNNPHRKDDAFKMPDGKAVKIPYLNGGLFEDDDPIGILTFPPKLFADLFEFFNQYNFTIYEDSPDDHTVAVDPEMLGHIFENLLEDNKDKGAFYTPKEIVHYMCQESLIEYLCTKLNIQNTASSYQELGKPQTNMFGNEARAGQLALMQGHKTESTGITREDVERLIKHKDVSENIIRRAKEINRFLDELKICDPAIGSGAFPMGLLHEIFDAKHLLYLHCHSEQSEESFNAAQVKQGIIQNSIYGVDIEKGAVNIARLRFWLSLIVDEDLPRPLPNLDYKIVVGDSLLPKFEGEVVDIDWDTKSIGGKEAQAVLEKIQKGLNEIVKKQKQYFDAPEKDKMSLKAEIRNLKMDLLINQLALDKIKYAFNSAITQDMFEKTKKNTEVLLRLKGFDNTIRKLEQLKKQPDKPLQFFDWKLDFPEIMNPAVAGEKEGFDIAIGNPPYVFARNSAAKGLTEFNKRYFYDNYELAEYQINLYPLFIEKGTQLLHSAGILSFITPNNWLTINTNKTLRKFVLARSGVVIVNFYARVFENADVDSSIIIYQKSGGRNTVRLMEYSNEFRFIKEADSDFFLKQRDHVINIEAFKGNGGISDLMSKIESQSDRLGSVADVKAGLKAYEVGKGNPPQTEKMKRERIYHSVKKVDSKYIKYLDGKNVCRYRLDWSGEYLKYGNNLAAPRKDFRLYSTKRILVRQIPAKPPYCINACIAEETCLNDLNSMNIINMTESPEAILGIINSRLTSFWFLHKFGKMQRETFPQFKVNELAEFPLPKRRKDKANEIAEISRQILAAKQKNTQADTSALEKQIDEMVYALYDLTPEEIAVVEGRK